MKKAKAIQNFYADSVGNKSMNEEFAVEDNVFAELQAQGYVQEIQNFAPQNEAIQQQEAGARQSVLDNLNQQKADLDQQIAQAQANIDQQAQQQVAPQNMNQEFAQEPMVDTKAMKQAKATQKANQEMNDF
jgi:hypothetical protein